jgi:hypothetical protein
MERDLTDNPQRDSLVRSEKYEEEKKELACDQKGKMLGKQKRIETSCPLTGIRKKWCLRMKKIPI